MSANRLTSPATVRHVILNNKKCRFAISVRYNSITHPICDTGRTKDLRKNMESNSLEAKYRKLASEYSKLRAQASVLKTAVLDEQSKNSTLRETLRQKESSLRRSEQEVDSLGFRNKQLERRVASLQDDIATKENRKSNKNQKSDGSNNAKGKSSGQQDSSSSSTKFSDYFDNTQEVLIFEELQKKILENAELTSLIDDKNRELQIHVERIDDLEKQLEKRSAENIEMERRLRKEIDSFQTRISELETKLVEAASIIGSEDALSASGSDNTPLHTGTNSSTTSEDRIAYLEKEVSHWRTQYEISRISDSLPHEMSRLYKEKQQYNGPLMTAGSCCSLAATGLTVIAATNAVGNDIKGQQNDSNAPQTITVKEQLIFNNFCKKFEDLLKIKCVSESRLSSFQVESEHLQNCLENSTQDLKEKETELLVAGQKIETLEGDLATTRLNYEEQISILTEQVISLSEQLASCK